MQIDNIDKFFDLVFPSPIGKYIFSCRRFHISSVSTSAETPLFIALGVNGNFIIGAGSFHSFSLLMEPAIIQIMNLTHPRVSGYMFRLMSICSLLYLQWKGGVDCLGD